jgi:hypothetical protein
MYQRAHVWHFLYLDIVDSSHTCRRCETARKAIGGKPTDLEHQDFVADIEYRVITSERFLRKSSFEEA